MRDPLDPDARALWDRIVATVRPIADRHARRSPPVADHTPPKSAPPPRPAAPRAAPRPTPTPARDTLDGGWDRRLKRGVAAPDLTIDLHGHTLASAHAALDRGLARALAQDARLVLLVTGRPPPPGRSRLDDPLRGLIRASVVDWLDHSAHAARIAAIRPAHPRHGGAGALYLVLRRVR